MSIYNECTNIGGVIREDLIAEGIQKIFSLGMLKTLIASPTTRWLLFFRLGSYMKGKKQWSLLYPIIYMFYRHLQYKTGIQIRLGTKLGSGLRFVHFGDIVLNGSARLGKNCVVFNGVTLGAAILGGKAPIVGDNVVICTGAKLIGDIKVGSNVIIGAGAVVVKDVPDNAVVAGVPAKILSMDGAEKVKLWIRE